MNMKRHDLCGLSALFLLEREHSCKFYGTNELVHNV